MMGRNVTISGDATLIDHYARRVTEDLVAGAKVRRGGLPAAVEPISEKLIRRRLMIPHGDRRDGSQSGGIEAEVDRRVGKNDVMSILILRYDLGDVDRW
jgi:hypothetical protein